MKTFAAHASFKRSNGVSWGPCPPRRQIHAMIADVERDLRAVGYAPARVVCATWCTGGLEYIAGISIEAEIGELTKPLISWFEWQHPRWEWAPPPAAIAVSTAPMLPVPA